MKILVAGATGAIGSALTVQLASLGHALLITARDIAKLEALSARTATTTSFNLLKWFIVQASKAGLPAQAVLTSSIVAHSGFANHEAIAAAKAAVTALAMSTAATYAAKGIRVNIVASGLIRSPFTQRFIATAEAEARFAAMIPTQRIGEPDEVAGTIVFLLSPAAAHITGQLISVDAGLAMVLPLPRTSAYH